NRVVRHADGHLLYPGAVRVPHDPDRAPGVTGPPGDGGRGGTAGRVAVRPGDGRAPGRLPAVDTGILPAPGEAPAQHDGGEQPPDHVAEDGPAEGEPPREHGG